MIATYKESSLYAVDLSSLEDGCWLTGEIIHFGYLLLEEEFPFPHVKLVNPSLISFLLFQDDEQDLLPLQKLELFKHRYLYLPINTNSKKHQNGDHWVLCIYDTLKSEFYMLNSMNNYPDNVQKLKVKLQRLRLLLNKQEANIKIQMINSIPKQDNLYDCGVFLLFYTYSTLKAINNSQTHTLNFHKVQYSPEYFKQIREKLKKKLLQCKP